MFIFYLTTITFEKEFLKKKLKRFIFALYSQNLSINTYNYISMMNVKIEVCIPNKQEYNIAHQIFTQNPNFTVKNSSIYYLYLYALLLDPF